MAHLESGRRIAVVAMAAMLVASACSSNAGTAAPSASAGAGGKTLTIGLADADLQYPFFEAVRQGVVAEATKQGVNVIFQSAADGAQQTTQVKQMLAQKIDALIYLPSGADAATVPVADANAAGVPVVTVDRDVKEGDVVTFIAADSVPGSKEVCDYLVKNIGAKGEVLIIEGQVGTTPWEQRTEGCEKQSFGANPGITVVGKTAADWNREKGYNAARDLLQAHPNVVGIFGMSDDMAIGAASAAEAAGMDPFVVGFDGLPGALQAIKDGKVDATALQPAFHLGELAAQAAIKAANGDTADIPRIQMIPTELVTKDNVDEYLNKGYYGTLG